ncbi:hypothetical protein ABIA33_007426 [Streptacidiphilus sp. MAP12-16]
MNDGNLSASATWDVTPRRWTGSTESFRGFNDPPGASARRRGGGRRDADVFAALMEGMIAEAARRGQADLSLVSVDSTVPRAHHDAAGMVVDPEVLTALEEAAAEKKGRRKPGKPPQ